MREMNGFGIPAVDAVLLFVLAVDMLASYDIVALDFVAMDKKHHIALMDILIEAPIDQVISKTKPIMRHLINVKVSHFPHLEA